MIKSTYRKGSVASALALFLALALLTSACGGDAQPAGDSSGSGLGAEPTPATQTRPTRAPTPTPQPAGQPASSAEVADDDPLGNLPSIPLSTDRVIVRSVDLTLVVKEVTRSLTRISEVATSFGGWVVSSNQDQPHVGQISIRVPAARLEQVVALFKSEADLVETESSSSQDFTDEFVDTQARVSNLKATQQALARLMEKAESIEDALKVQDELNKVLEEIEVLQGRLNLLSQTSAFSLITVDLKVDPVGMEVDAGPDLVVRYGDLTKFQARLFPPQDVTNFSFSWKFGDGSSPLSGDRTIAEVVSDAVVTATVGHAYKNADDSPFIASIEVLGTGDAGVAEGQDSIVVTVLQIPSIDVFAGEDLEVSEDQKVSFNGSFTRPKGLTNPRFQWDFGDGSEPFGGSITSDVTSVNATHQYNNHRPRPYVATLKVTASSDAGIVEASDTVTVMVSERGDWIVAWHINDIVRTAVLGITAIGLALFAILVWLGIFSPLWLTVLAIWYFLARRTRARIQRDGPFNPVPEPSFSSRLCPSCGTRKEPMVKFCTNCGSAMDTFPE